MGVEYYVIQEESKKFYDLGNGNWYELNDFICIQDKDTLYGGICQVLYSGYWKFEDGITREQYAECIASTLAQLEGNISVVNEYFFEDGFDGWCKIGDRYSDYRKLCGIEEDQWRIYEYKRILLRYRS